MDDLIYKEESYQIIGCCYEVFNKLGHGLRECNYQKALEQVLIDNQIVFESQVYVPLKINNEVIGKYYLDLLVNNAIAIELKVGDRFYKKDIAQLYSYLKSRNLKLGLLINFTSSGVIFKRIVNIK